MFILCKAAVKEICRDNKHDPPIESFNIYSCHDKNGRRNYLVISLISTYIHEITGVYIKTFNRWIMFVISTDFFHRCFTKYKHILLPTDTIKLTCVDIYPIILLWRGKSWSLGVSDKPNYVCGGCHEFLLPSSSDNKWVLFLKFCKLFPTYLFIIKTRTCNLISLIMKIV
jgi:hypothetical protein